MYLQELSKPGHLPFQHRHRRQVLPVEPWAARLSCTTTEFDEVRDFLACMKADDDEYAYPALRQRRCLLHVGVSDAARMRNFAARSELGLPYRDASGHDDAHNGTIALRFLRIGTRGGVSRSPLSPAGSASTPFPEAQPRSGQWQRGRASSASTVPWHRRMRCRGGAKVQRRESV